MPAGVAIWVERHPEFPVVAVAAAAWVPLVSASLGEGNRMPAHHGAVMPAMHSMASPSVASTVWLWSVMTVAMMLPMTVPSLRYIGRMVPRAGRLGALTVFCVAFVAAWSPLALLSALVHPLLPLSGRIVAAAFVAAAAWELTPVKRWALLHCHRPAVVRAAQPGRLRTCCSFGLRRGVACVAGCWPAMVALVLAGHSLVALGGTTAVLVVQQYAPDAYRYRARSAAALAAVAVVPLFVA